MLKYFFILASLLFLSTSNYADTTKPPERILLFDSNIKVKNLTSIDVTEIISVYADDHIIENGITRSLPLTYIDRTGASHVIHYQIGDTLVNGKKTSHVETTNHNKFTITIKDKNKKLTPGIYSYTIQYQVNDIVSPVNNQYQLNWNITGNEWNLLIAKAQVDITLPNQTKDLKYLVLAGKPDEKHKNVITTQPSPSQLNIVTTQPLQPFESLIVTLIWPQHLIKSTAEKLKSIIN